ncbi:MAG: PQQ-dependent sugar dehydrogenase [Planctomycetota bacterium]|nr:PQQ-dependent sugar dehydrogenase [Planctomycetota bacterium]
MTTRHIRSFMVIACACAAAGLAEAAPPMTVRIVATGLSQPVAIAAMPTDSTHLYVAQRAGTIARIDTATGQVDPTPFLNITSSVRAFGDGGLLGLVFDPAFASTGYFYVYYTRQPDSQGTLVRYHVDPFTGRAEPASASLIFTYPRDAGGHNGGWIGISPRDGFLYLSSGDGGTAVNPDPINAAQTITGGQFQGKMLRLDPSGDDYPLDADRNYRIPASNPFVATAADPEIWSYGLRNAWRCSFDRATGDLWMADVGQDDFEEINVERAGEAGGRNYGWRCQEGFSCTGYGGCQCPIPGSTDPFLAYDHTIGQSITGGYVYRGAAIPGLEGSYLCADWQTARLFVVAPSATPVLEDVTAQVEPGGTPLLTYIASFGEAANGELYMADWLHGRVLKLVSRVAGACCIAGTCQVLTEGACNAAGGVFSGTGTACDDLGICPSPCEADFNQDGGVDGSDIESFFVTWETGDAAADVNVDGGVDGSDIEYFFVRWEAGC